MKLEINIDEKEFGIDIADHFQDFFKRLQAEIKSRLVSNDTLVCENYELEIIEMFLTAFKNATIEQEPSRDIKEIEEVINCDTNAETKCKMISNILTAKPHYFKEQEPTNKIVQKAYEDGKKDGYVQAKLEQEPTVTSTNNSGEMIYPQVEGITPTVVLDETQKQLDFVQPHEKIPVTLTVQKEKTCDDCLFQQYPRITVCQECSRYYSDNYVKE